MILRHYQILHHHNSRPVQRLTPAGRFWTSYAVVALLVLAWWLA